MSKAKAYTRMILQRLQKKGQQEPYKSNNNSNQKTQATPNQHRHPPASASAFFQDFQRHCAVYHEPIRIAPYHPPVRRPLFSELAQMQRQTHHPSRQHQQTYQEQQYYNIPLSYQQKKMTQRIQTEPYVSQFNLEQKSSGIRVLGTGRQNKSMVVVRRTEERNYNIKPQQALNRYRSLRTLQTSSQHQIGARKITGSVFERKEHPKYERKQPRRQLYHRCQSYERFMLARS